MKINENELNKIANQLNIELDEKEIEQISESINRITDKLDEIFNEDTLILDETRTMSENEYDLSTKIPTKSSNIDMKTVNNYNGQYVEIEKGEENE